MPLATPMTVMVTDISGLGVADVLVRFNVASGGGWITESEVFTDAAGRASTIWYMGPRPGNENVLTVSSPVGGTGYRAYVLALEPGVTYRGASDYVQMTVGDLPLLLSVPHGGDLSPAVITSRSNPTTPDPETAELAAAIVDAFAAHGAGRPSLVVSRVAPHKVDPDRPFSSTERDRIAERTWREYHGFMAAARAYIQDNFTRGMYIDVHGHDGAAVELGYLLTATELAANNTVLDQPAFPGKSSIRAIALANHPSFSTILRGELSLGALIAAQGYRTTPSPLEPAPVSTTYQPGGVSLERYGSRDGIFVSGIFLQTPMTGVRDTPANRSRFADVVADALDRYFATFFATSLFSK